MDDLKDDNEQYRKMVMESIEKILANLGAADIDSKLEEALIDGILYAFQEQTTEVRECYVMRGCTTYEFCCIFSRCRSSIKFVYSFIMFITGCSNVERVRHHSQPTGQTREAVPTTDLRYNIMAYEQ